MGRGLFRSAYFLYKRYIEDDLEGLIGSRPGLIRSGNVLDIGANIGFTATVLARAVAPGYRVYSFEPEPHNFAMLQAIASRPAFKTKITPVQCAVGAEEGTVELWQNLRHHGDHRVITDQFRSALPGVTGIKVPMVTIDAFLLRNPGPVSFVKIDVQGFELPVCQGMSRTIEMNRDLTIVLEYAPLALHNLGFDPLQLIDFLVGRGFQINHLRPKGELCPGIPTQVADTDYVNLLFSRRPPEGGKPK
jgi:FkbM family methyltransferase